MIKIGILIIAVLLLVGCQTTGPKTYSANSESRSVPTSNSCDFDQIPRKAYLISPSFKTYITNSFFFDPSKESVWQLDKSKYSSLISQEFKVVETGVVTQEDIKSRLPYLSEYRFDEDEIGGIPHIRDKAYSSKLVTSDCSVFYLNGNTNVKSLLSSVVNLDGSKINEDDALALYGTKPFKKKNMDASVEYDRFEKTLKVASPYHDNMFIRGSINTKNQSVSNLQLYVDLAFFDKWGFVSNALDTDGINHEIVKISTDTDCSNSDLFGCKLTETIGITIDEDFLNRNKNGFEMKVFGTKEKIIKVSSHMIEGFLLGLNKAKDQARSGNFGAQLSQE